MLKRVVNFQSLSKLADDNIDIRIMAQSIPSVNPTGHSSFFFFFFLKNCKSPTVGPAGTYQYSAVCILYFASPCSISPVTLQRSQVPHFTSPRPIFRVPASCYSTSSSPSSRVPESQLPVHTSHSHFYTQPRERGLTECNQPSQTKSRH